jgi:hypothetical protein
MMAGMMMYAVVMNGIAEVHKVRFQRCGHLLYRSDLSMSRPGSAGILACLFTAKRSLKEKSRQGGLRSEACAPRVAVDTWSEFQFGAVTGRLGE